MNQTEDVIPYQYSPAITLATTLLPVMTLQQLTIVFRNKTALYSKPSSVDDILNCPKVKKTREGWKTDALAGHRPKKVHNRYILYLMLARGSLVAIRHYWKCRASSEEKSLYYEARLMLDQEREREMKGIHSRVSSMSALEGHKPSGKIRAPRPNKSETKSNSPNHEILPSAQGAAIPPPDFSYVPTNQAFLSSLGLNPSDAYYDSTMIPESSIVLPPPVMAQWYNNHGHYTPFYPLQTQPLYDTHPTYWQDHCYPRHPWNSDMYTLPLVTPPHDVQSVASPYTAPHLSLPSTSSLSSDSDMILNEFGFPSPTGCFDDSAFGSEETDSNDEPDPFTNCQVGASRIDTY